MIEYGYAESGWKDRLTSYKGEEITYDAIGNPLTYRDGMTMTWEGRQLSSLTRSGTTSTYKYDADGLRTKKTVGNIATVYQYVNGQLLRERRSNGVVLRYAYDALGNLATIQYTNVNNWTRTFYVRTKLNGDVDQIYDTSGNLIAKYTYDAWGSTISITDADGKAITASTHVAVVNPIRYRGYYWDAETGFYYLQSRYYDPETKRFINADELLGVNAGAQYNLYAYCGNRPVDMVDSSGMYPIESVDDTDVHRMGKSIEEWNSTRERNREAAKRRAREKKREFVCDIGDVILDTVNIQAGVGAGIGIEYTIYGLGVSACVKYDTPSLSILGENRFNLGSNAEASIGISVEALNVNLLYDQVFSSVLCNRGESHTGCNLCYESVEPSSSITIWSIGGYVVYGGSASIDWDYVQFFSRMGELYEKWK